VAVWPISRILWLAFVHRIFSLHTYCKECVPYARDIYSLKIRCEGEVQQCILSNTFNSDFEEVISSWHEKCDPHTSVTTPLIEPLSTTVNVGVGLGDCSSILESCNSWIRETSACKSSYTAMVDLNSCECQPSMISLASVCEYDGNVSCWLTSADSTNLWEYYNCRGLSLTLVSVSE